MAIDPSIPLGYKANSGDFGDMVRMADMLNQYRFNASARPIQIQQQRMEVEKQKQEQLEQEVLKREYSKYLDGNGDGDREGYMRAISPYVRPQILSDLRKEFMTLDAHKAEAKKAEQESAEREGLKNAATKFEQSIRPTQKPISTIPVEQVTKEQAMEAATGTGNVTIPGKNFQAALQESGLANYALTQPDLADRIVKFAELYGIGKKGETQKRQWQGKRDDMISILSKINPFNGKPIVTKEDEIEAQNQWDQTYVSGQEYGLRPAIVSRLTTKAAMIKEAQNLATDKMPDTDRNKLTAEQGIVTTLENAHRLYNSKYATAYAGKIIKLSVLRQNDTKFADFVTNLGLAMNEYRRQNFGTAQTAQEIQNFLDVINTDLAVKGEVLQKQIETVLNFMKDSYYNKLTALQGNNYIIPDNMLSPTISQSTRNKPTENKSPGNGKTTSTGNRFTWQ